ncbi:MAG: glycosyl hydrolase family 28-related protein [Cyanobacteria bacterium P01_A01_bin.83]
MGVILAFFLPTLLSSKAEVQTAINFEFPPGSVVDLVSEYDVIPDDGLDDTAGIQKALNENADQNRIIYFRNGVYDVSDTLTLVGARRFNTLQGQNEAKTIIRLRDRAPLFAAEIGERKPLLNIPPGESADRFQNAIYNLTFDVGRGNPMADGLWFISNNQGGLRQVTIKSSSNQEGIGLSLADGLNGPMLAKEITIEGFQIGIRTGNAVNSQTFEGIQLRNQGFTGIYNTQQVINIRKLVSEQQLPIPPLISGEKADNAIHWFGLTTIIDSKLKYTGEGSAPYAISAVGNAYARNISLEGYQNAAFLDYANFRQSLVKNELLPLDGAGITEWKKSYREDSQTNLVSRLFEQGISKSLTLGVKETPDVPWDKTSQWVNVADFMSGDGQSDATAAFQAAIDSMKVGGRHEGKTTLYIPSGIKYRLNGVVEISGPVRRIIGLAGRIQGTVDGVTSGGFRIVDSGQMDAPLIRFERLSGFGSNFLLEHQSKREVAVVNTAGVKITSTGSGDFYLEDVVATFARFKNAQQRIWARQFNLEGRGTKITNRGARLWVFGLKTEKFGTVIDTSSGGFTEVIGGLIYRVAKTIDDNAPMFSITDAHATFAGIGEMDGTAAKERHYSTIISETRNHNLRTGKRERFQPGRHNGSCVLYLYIGATQYPPKIYAKAIEKSF